MKKLCILAMLSTVLMATGCHAHRAPVVHQPVVHVAPKPVVVHKQPVVVHKQPVHKQPVHKQPAHKQPEHKQPVHKHKHSSSDVIIIQK